MVTRETTKGANLFSAPPPSKIAINDARFSWDNLGVGDNLQIVNGSNVQYAMWYVSPEGKAYWSTIGRGDKPTGEPADFTIEGSAFWVISTGSTEKLSMTYSNE